MPYERRANGFSGCGLGFGGRSGRECTALRQTGVTPEEVEEVLENPTDADVSRSTGKPVVFGNTRQGRHLIVVYELLDADTVYPITAYEVPRKRKKRSQK